MSKYQTLNIDDPFDETDDIIIEPDTPPQLTTSKPIHTENPFQDLPLPQTPLQQHTDSLTKSFEGGYFSLNHYRQYFNIDTNEFIDNCKSSLNPLAKLPNDDNYESPGDLYGAVWITATLLFLLFFCNSLAELLSSWFSITNPDDSIKINYFKMLVSSINLLYGYIIIIPTLLYLIIAFYLKISPLMSLTKFISIYAYTNLLWIPAALLSIFRGFLINHNGMDSILKWTCIAIGALLSGCSIMIKLKDYFDNSFSEENEKEKITLLALLGLAHFGFAIGVKVCFFGNL